ncbi:MAG: CusA/CzcA family heavy metal efflux RND transporter [Candidatus Kapaibacterium sp.]
MLNGVIAFSLRHRVLVLFCTGALVVGGVIAFSRLPIDAVPDITNNQVQILTNAPALSALEIERFVTFPIELSVKSLPDMVELRSLSRPGLSVITVVFEDRVNTYFARQLILEKLREIEETLPDGVERPELGPVSTGLGEIFRYVVRDTTNRYSPMELRTIQDWIVRRELLGADALAEVNSLGGELKQYQILVDPDRLANYDISLRDVFRAATEASDNAGGAYIETGPEQLSVRSVGLTTTVDDIRESVIGAYSDGTPLRIGDVAEVTTGPAIRFGSASQDGRGEVVVGIVMQLKGANARVTDNGVKERIEENKPLLPEGVVIEPFYDREALVDRTIETVLMNLIEGALLVVGILLLFLVSLRAGLIVASVIPLAMCFAGIMMLLSGQSGNLMSLGAIDFGLVVDGSLIIVENILRLMDRRFRDGTSSSITSGEMRQLVYEGSVEVRTAAQFGEIIIIVVYLPIITLQGIEGKLFRPMALTVTFALIGALLLSITYVPAISSLLLRGEKRVRHSPIIEWIRRGYTPLLNWGLRNRPAIIGTAFGLVLLALFGFTRLGGEFIPRLDEGDIAMHLIRLPSISLSESQKIATAVEKELMTFPEVKTVVSHTGRAEVSTDPMGFELADVFIMLREEDEWTTGRTKEELVEAMAERMKKFPGVGTQFLQPIEMRMNELIAGARGDVVVKIFGEAYETLSPAAEKISGIIRTLDGAADVAVEQTRGLSQLVIRPDRNALARYGLSVAEVNHAVGMAVAGEKAGTVYEGEQQFDLVVRYRASARTNVDAIREILVKTPVGALVPLKELASVKIEEGPAQISREGSSRFTTVQANVRGRDVESFVEELREHVEREVELPPGYRIDYGGEFRNLEDASQRLLFVVPIALFLIFALLYQTFGSFRLGLLIFLCIPMSVVGGVAALLIRGMPFSISAGVGFIALFGIAVLNGIVMVAAIRKYQLSGLSRREAVTLGAEERLRPVITTAALAGFGFLPMMLATSAGAEVQRPLATVVIGGLISATLLTLILLPIIYERFGDDPSTASTDEKGKEKRSSRLWKGGVGLFLLLCFSIGTPSLSGQTVLTRQLLIERGLATSPERDRVHASVERVDAEGRSANILPPTSLFYEVEEYPTGSLPGELTTSIGISQPFPFPSTWGANSRAKRAAFLAAEGERAVVDCNIVGKANQLWLDLIHASWHLNLTDTMTANARRIAEIIRFRRTVGEIDALEATQGEIILAEAQRDSIAAHSRFVGAMRRARSFMAAAEGEEFVLRVDSISLFKRQNREELIGQLREHHPHLHLLERQIEALEARNDVLRASRLPSFELELRSQRVGGEGGYIGAGIRLNAPITRWFGDPKGDALQAEERELRAEMRQRERDLIRQLDDLLIEREEKEELIKHYQTTLLPAARSAWQIGLRLYQEGEIGYLGVVSAHNTLVTYEREWLERELDVERIDLQIEGLVK